MNLFTPISLIPSRLDGQVIELGRLRSIEARLGYSPQRMQAGPFVTSADSHGDRRLLRCGEVSDVQMSIALCCQGGMQIELIRQAKAKPSSHNDLLAGRREGLQHVGFMSDDYTKTFRPIEHSGFDEICSIRPPDGAKNATYCGGPVAHLGVMVEIAPVTPLRHRYYRAIKRLADNWDGFDPVQQSSRTETLTYAAVFPRNAEHATTARNI